jgi:hypothetical protein
VSEGPDPTVSLRSQRVLRAILPIGIALLITWAAWLVVAIAIGDDTQRGFSIVSAILGLVTSLVLIVSGRYYRRALRRQ